MFNPFARFDKKYIPAFRKVNKRYLVSQTFNRENNLFKDSEKNYLLLSHYDDKGLAQIHFNAVKQDRFAAVIDLEKEAHREKLQEMLTTTSKYVLYSSLITDPGIVKNVCDKIFKYEIQKYITEKTDWRISREQTIKPLVEVTFGELFVILKYGRQAVRVKLDEIENI